MGISSKVTPKSVSNTSLTRVKVALMPASASSTVPPMYWVYSPEADTATRYVLSTWSSTKGTMVFPTKLDDFEAFPNRSLLVVQIKSIFEERPASLS